MPSLGGAGKGGARGGFGRFGGFGDAEDPVDEESNDGFDDFDIVNEDAFGDSSNKFDDAEKHLKDFYKEENEGFKISAGKKGTKATSQSKKQDFKVNIPGANRKESLNDDDFEEEIIEEDI